MQLALLSPELTDQAVFSHLQELRMNAITLRAMAASHTFPDQPGHSALEPTPLLRSRGLTNTARRCSAISWNMLTRRPRRRAMLRWSSTNLLRHGGGPRATSLDAVLQNHYCRDGHHRAIVKHMQNYFATFSLYAK